MSTYDASNGPCPAGSGVSVGVSGVTVDVDVSRKSDPYWPDTVAVNRPFWASTETDWTKTVNSLVRPILSGLAASASLYW